MMTHRSTLRRMLIALAATALLLAPRAPATHAAAPVTLYQITDLGTLGGSFSSGQSLNNRGQIAGYSADAAGDLHAFRWQDGVMSDLGTLAGTSAGFNSFGLGINANGAVTGQSDTPSSSDAFLARGDDHEDRGATLVDLGTLGGQTSAGQSINASQQVAGGSDVTTLDPTNPGAQELHAFLWRRGAMSDLGTLGTGPDSDALALDDAGRVTGWTTINTGNDPEAGGPDFYTFLWQHGVMTNLGTLPGGNYSQGNAINNRGQVAGYAETALVDSSDADCGSPTTFHSVHAALWQGGTVSDLSPFSSDPDSLAFGINNRGQVVGRSGSICNSTGAALWQNGTVTDLNTVIPANSGWFLVRGRSINERGQITGDAVSPSGDDHAFLLTPVGQGEPHAVDRQAEARARQAARAPLVPDAQDFRHGFRPPHGHL